jgi:hypothetical protein
VTIQQPRQAELRRCDAEFGGYAPEEAAATNEVAAREGDDGMNAILCRSAWSNSGSAVR